MSKRVIWSLILIALAVSVVLIDGSMIGGLVATFFLMAMLLVWAMPRNSSGKSGPGLQRLALAGLGIGLGLLASITAVLILPPQVFPWVMMAVGIGIIIWYFMPKR